MTNSSSDHEHHRGPMILFVVFDAAVKGVINDKGEKARPPTVAAWGQTTWLQGKSKLQISGSDKLWGPWGGLQVWEADLAANADPRCRVRARHADRRRDSRRSSRCRARTARWSPWRSRI